MKKRYFAILAAVLVLAAGVFCFRDWLMVRAFPRMVLTQAVAASFDELEERYADSPAHILAQGLDPNLCQQISMALNTSTKFAGVVRYNLELNTQTGPNRVTATGTVTHGGKTMDLELYLDENFGAVSSESITGGMAYGLTYDTFLEDIRSHTLLATLIGEDVLTDWNASVARFADHMRSSYTVPRMTPEDLQTALLGALALKPQVSAGEEKHSYQVTFRADCAQIGDIAGKYRDQIPENLLPLVDSLDEKGNLEVVFFLQGRVLTGISLSMDTAIETYRIDVALTGDTITAELRSGMDTTGISIRTRSDTETYRETIHLLKTQNGSQTRFTADYTYDLSTGEIDMDLTRDGKSYDFRLNLSGEGESFTIHCQEFEQILSLISGKENTRPAICTLTIRKGEPVAALTQYRNLSEWSLDEFWNLMRSLGSLVGLKLT